jgi:hypothetical protein
MIKDESNKVVWANNILVLKYVVELLGNFDSNFDYFESQENFIDIETLNQQTFKFSSIYLFIVKSRLTKDGCAVKQIERGLPDLNKIL